MSLTVIKLGGSLMHSPDLSAWLEHIEIKSKTTNVVIVPGGGEFADSIRSFQKRYQFDDLAAHKMALLAMCQYGHLLVSLNAKLKVVNDINVLKSHLGKHLPLLWLPLSLIEDHSEIPASWDFTSDSISLWLAIKLEAEKLMLVKSKAMSNDKTLVINYINNGDIDKGFQLLTADYSGEISFFEKSQYALLNE